MRFAELLAPAGNWSCLRAAVENGADAVYFGVEALNARARAENFAAGELPAIMHYLRSRGVRGYLTLNVIIFSDEIERAAELLVAASDAGVDAVLVQDLGLARLAASLTPALPIHASTQMTVTSPDAAALLHEWGVERFVLPREFSVDDIRAFNSAGGVATEAFVHGALCVAYSGQCLTSEALGGRSANRGECAQACRQPYRLVADGRELELGQRRYLLSPRDLAGVELIPALLEAGVTAFKIEGRLKTPEYVANVTRAYRGAIDRALAGKEGLLAKEEWNELAQSFSRGLGTGFLLGADHQTLVQGDFPKSRGLAAGAVTAVKPPSVFIGEARVPLKPGDGLVFDDGDPERDEPGGPIFAVHAGEPLHIELARDFPFERVRVGDRVWKTSDPALNRRLRDSYARDRRTVPVTLYVSGRAGAPLMVTARSGGFSATVASVETLAAAAGAGLDAKLLREKLGRLGGTRYHLDKLNADLDQPLMVPVSALNRVRRALVERLDAMFAVAVPRPKNEEALARIRRSPLPATSDRLAEIAVFCRSEAQIRAACALGVDRVYADFEDPRGFRESVAVARGAGVPIFLATPRVSKPGERGFLRKLAGYAPDGVLVRNLDGLLYFKEHHPALALIGDFSLNCANDLTARELLALGFEAITPSYDLNAEQLGWLLERIPGAYFEIVLHQHMPMFHMEHCVFAAVLSSGKDHRDCGRPCERHDIELLDHTGALLPVKADVGCRNTVFNGHAQSGALYLPMFQRNGVRRFRIEFLNEDEARVQATIATYRRLLAGECAPKDAWASLRANQRLGVTRGTLDH